MGDFDFRIATGLSGVDGGSDALQMMLDVRPLLVAEDDDSNLSPGEILLEKHVLIRCQEQFITGIFGVSKQLAVLEFMPADLTGKRYFMSDEATRDGVGRAVVE